MHRGYIKLYRRVSENPLWTGEKFTRGQAWIDLIMLANHKDGLTRKRGITIPIQRGVCGWSMLGLSARWRWSRGKTRRFLNHLEAVQQIEQQKTKITTLIKIVNYDQYQMDDTTKRTTDGQQNQEKRYNKQDNKNGQITNRNQMESELQSLLFETTKQTTDGQKTDTNKNIYNIVGFLLKNGEKYIPDEKYISSLADLFPNVNMESEFKNIAAWCLSNPGKRKTSRGAKKFINNWISNCQARWNKEHPPQKKGRFVA